MFSYGVKPGAVIGLSMGEVAALQFAGVLDASDAIMILKAQNKFMEQETKPGKMGFVDLGEPEVERILRKFEAKVSVAGELSPSLTLISGELNTMKSFLALLKSMEIRAGFINVDFAFHSPEIKMSEQEFLSDIKSLRTKPESVPVYSSISGKRQHSADFGPTYWWHLRSLPAKFSALIQSLIGDGFRTFVVVAPHPSLVRPISEIALSLGEEVTILPTIIRDDEECFVFQESIRALRLKCGLTKSSPERDIDYSWR